MIRREQIEEAVEKLKASREQERNNLQKIHNDVKASGFRGGKNYSKQTSDREYGIIIGLTAAINMLEKILSKEQIGGVP